jgi:hypothetical protein
MACIILYFVSYQNVQTKVLRGQVAPPRRVGATLALITLGQTVSDFTPTPTRFHFPYAEPYRTGEGGDTTPPPSPTFPLRIPLPYRDRAPDAARRPNANGSKVCAAAAPKCQVCPVRASRRPPKEICWPQNRSAAPRNRSAAPRNECCRSTACRPGAHSNTLPPARTFSRFAHPALPQMAPTPSIGACSKRAPAPPTAHPRPPAPRPGRRRRRRLPAAAAAEISRPKFSSAALEPFLRSPGRWWFSTTDSF